MDLFEDIARRPNDYRVLERVPFTLDDVVYPIELDCLAGDEECLVLLDCETTGLDVEKDALTEIGITRVLYSPSLGKLTQVVDSYSWYQDPLQPIPDFITRLTGITDEMVSGKVVDANEVLPLLQNDPIVICHNAGFDRKFVDKYLPWFPKNLRWACSASEIDWIGAGLESKKLEYLLFKLNYFYSGHRADVDTKVMAFLFYKRPDLLQSLLENAAKRKVIVRAIGSPFDVKDALKHYGFKWNDGTKGHEKHWFHECPESKLDEVLAFMTGLYSNAKKAQIEYFDARQRYL